MRMPSYVFLSEFTIGDGVAIVAVRACLHREHDGLVFVLRIFMRGHLATLHGLALSHFRCSPIGHALHIKADIAARLCFERIAFIAGISDVVWKIPTIMTPNIFQTDWTNLADQEITPLNP